MIDLVVVVGFIQAFSNFWSSDSCQNQNQIWNIFAEPHQSCLPCFITHKNKGNKMWVCLNCHEYNSSENENCSECHSARPQSRTGNTKAKVSPKELDSRALDDRKECNVNEAIGDIINISDSERTNVKNENSYLDGMKQIQKPDCQGPVMSRNQTESSPERLPTTRPGRQGGQSYTNQYQERPQKKYTNLGYNQPPNQFQGCNQPPNQYQGNSQEMYTNQGHNQQSNQHQIYNQPQNQYQAYNHPPPPQHFQYVIVPFPVLSGSPSGHGPAPYPPVVMPPYNPPNLPQGNQDSRRHKRGRGGNNRGRGGKYRQKDEDESHLTDDSYQTNRGYQGHRGRGREQKRERGGHEYNGNRTKVNENEDLDNQGNHRGMGKDRDKCPGRGGKQQHGRKYEQDDEDIPGVDENDVFKFLIKSFSGGCPFEEFLKQCHLFPKGSNICQWFRKHSRKFRVFWDGNDIVYLQPFCLDARICGKWNYKQNPGQCQNDQCNSFHICRRFIRGNCNESNCSLSHTFTNPHNRHLKDKLGINDFSDTDIKIVLNCNSPSVCADYIYNNGCKVENGEKRCPHLHLCEKNIFGNCKDPCKFEKTHSITQFHNNWVLRSWHMNEWPEAQVLRSIYVPPRQKKVNDDYTDDSNIRQDEDYDDDASVRYNSDVNVSSEIVPSTASGPAKIFNKSITSVENLSIEDVRERRKMKPGRRDRFKSSKDIISGNVGKDDQGLPKMSEPQQKYVDIKEKERLLMEKYKQEKQGTSSGNVVKPKPPPKPSKLSPSDPDYQEKDPSMLKDETENFKICIFVSKEKCKAASCKNLHLTSAIPYLWQIKMFGKWFSLTLAENEKIEKGYCNLLDIESTEVKYNGSKYSYHIWFSKMQAIIYDVDGQPAVDDNQHDRWCNVRRLSTPSFTEKKMMVDSYLTQWRWYWKDDSKKWNLYNKDVFLFTLERKYQTKQKTYLYTRENYFCMYRIDFLKMIQVNLETDRKQNITRRPLFVSKDDVNEKKFPDSIQFPAAMKTAKPVHFYHWDCAHDFELVELDIKGKEFNEVLKSLQDSMSQTLFETKFIFRIQNRKLWSEYDIKKKLILADAEKDGRGQSINERDLFHGTDSLDACRGICTNNFDFRTSGRNATVYGEGSYFAVLAKMSHSYTKADLPTDIRFMFRAKVLVGQFTTGNPSLRRPPEIPGKVHKLYDSCVDKDQDPQIFVVFDRNQCYPEYLIMYREVMPPVDQTIAAPKPSTIQSFPKSSDGSAGKSSVALKARLNEDTCVVQ